MSSSFTSLSLLPALTDNLSSLGYLEMTPIQAQSLPAILSGKDVIAQGKTGSGKTAAFGLAVLNSLNVKRFCVQALVLCPTRELADQVATELRKLGRGIPNVKVTLLCGGMPFGPQVGSLEYGTHIVVGTPGRVEDHLGRGTLKLDQVSMLVLDEADRMLDMGFQDTIDAIIAEMPAQRQTLLFSATFPDSIKSISKRVMHTPKVIQATEAPDSNTIEQLLYKVNRDEDRFTAAHLFLMQHSPDSAVVFCNTKIETEQLARYLGQKGFTALAINGDLEQRERDQALVRFANRSVTVLVATDVAARGLDIDDLDLVINLQIAHELEVHVHRIGRTGRAGSKGLACTLYTDKETHKVAALEDYLKHPLKTDKLPPASLLAHPAYKAPMVTIQISAGKRQKMRPGDILGALTGDGGIDGKDVGKIKVAPMYSFVAVERTQTNKALDKLTKDKIKGRFIPAKQLT